MCDECTRPWPYGPAKNFDKHQPRCATKNLFTIGIRSRLEQAISAIENHNISRLMKKSLQNKYELLSFAHPFNSRQENTMQATTASLDVSSASSKSSAATSANASQAHTLDSVAILQGQKSISIQHNGSIYRLQATKLGKLILTK